MRRAARIRIGCSGWQYRHWRGSFYPPELSQTRWFAHYALHFDTVEINNTFYRLPEAASGCPATSCIRSRRAVSLPI